MLFCMLFGARLMRALSRKTCIYASTDAKPHTLCTHLLRSGAKSMSQRLEDCIKWCSTPLETAEHKVCAQPVCGKAPFLTLITPDIWEKRDFELAVLHALPL